MSSLKISATSRKILHIAGIALLVIVAAAFIRVAVWEHFYYSEKEGTPRSTIDTPFTENDIVVDETEVTEEEVKVYTVAPDKPRYLSIEKLGLKNARILEVSADTGQPMGVPVGIFDVGWARSSGKPGQGGVLLMDGHNGGPTRDGVFKHLPSLVVGDLITIERGDGELFNYSVSDANISNISDANLYMRTLLDSPIPGRESLSLISCTGQWIQSSRTYDSRIMIRAVLLD